MQEDKSGTLGTGNDQTIFCMETQRDCVIPSQALTEVASTLRAGAGAPKHDADIRGRLAISYKRATCAGFEATPINLMVATRYKALGRGTGFGVGRPGDPANTISSVHSHGVFVSEKQAPMLNAECGGNKPAVVAPAVLCLNDQGGNVMGVSHDVSSTLRAQEHGHQPSILDMSHACDIIRDCGEVAPSLQARMGTGGNQVPLVTDCGFFNCYENISPTLLARTYKDPHIVASPEKTGSICAKSYPSKLANQDIVNGCYPAVKGGNGMVVRRLTPMECERLQGFPDGWTDIGVWCDSRGKLRKPSDSPRYKALGNSIALPFWDFLAKRISAQYLRPVTMGSLFDGIGGFPLVFERHNGKGTARWASEIEEFPIAVTKLRFGED